MKCHFGEIELSHGEEASDRLMIARNLGIRVGEHKKEVESKDMLRFMQKRKKATDEQQNKSTIRDHATRENHVTDWNG